MSLTFFKPNKKNTGHMFSFNFGPERKRPVLALYINAKKQVSWNDQTQTGTFAGSKKDITTKLDIFEVGAILDVIKKAQSFTYVSDKHTIGTIGSEDVKSDFYKFYNAKLYHSTDAASTTINFSPSVADSRMPRGFWLNLGKNSNGENERYSIPLTFAEATTLAVFLERGLNKSFEMVELETEKKSKKYDQKREGALQNSSEDVFVDFESEQGEQNGSTKEDGEDKEDPFKESSTNPFLED